VDQILPLLARMDGPILIGGDFNMVRWSNVLREFEHSSGSAMAPQGLNTFFMSYRGYRGPGFEIDHILLPARGPVTVERLGFLGSDHRGLLARFSL
jgi:endonuclease/exonuclease/phosphatase (EEP) superfamily protein YafD